MWLKVKGWHKVVNLSVFARLLVLYPWIHWPDPGRAAGEERLSSLLLEQDLQFLLQKSDLVCFLPRTKTNGSSEYQASEVFKKWELLLVFEVLEYFPPREHSFG